METTLDLATLTLEQFQPHLNADFQWSEQKLVLKLIEVKALRPPGDKVKRPPFSLLFATSSMPNPMVHQGIVRLEHQNLGNLEIFLVAIGQRQQGLLYEAIFN